MSDQLQELSEKVQELDEQIRKLRESQDDAENRESLLNTRIFRNLEELEVAQRTILDRLFDLESKVKHHFRSRCN